MKRRHIEMSAPIITTDKATTIVGTLPSLDPRPLGTNIDALETNLIDKLSCTPSFQSAAESPCKRHLRDER